MAQYVRHKSGQGEKWRLADAADSAIPHNEVATNMSWAVSEPGGANTLFLPKSEYVLCAPPEEWVDVTADCVNDPPNGCCTVLHMGSIVTTKLGYRFRKVNMGITEDKWAFIVEKRQP